MPDAFFAQKYCKIMLGNQALEEWSKNLQEQAAELQEKIKDFGTV